METMSNIIPTGNYGILLQDSRESELDEIVEQVKRVGYAILDSGFSIGELKLLSEAFNLTRLHYIKKYGESQLRKINEFHTVRAPLAHGDPMFIRLASNENLLNVLKRLIIGRFILNQQNCVINPPSEAYNQGSWHRDLPYQHYVSSSPLAVNALFCVDDFTFDNGSTFVLPATHKAVNYPSDSYIQNNAIQISAKSGQYILLDCMLFHSGGFNKTNLERRAINHIYTIPYFKQQIKLPGILDRVNLTLTQRELFGYGLEEPTSIEHYFTTRSK
jgi:ectoine hydroxylase-related dioxygenase (phytanoyl-CoA dioxygenase family)